MAPLVKPSTDFRRRSNRVARIRPSTNPRPRATPEVWFRIVYETPEGGKFVFTEYHLTVEVSLGPWAAFEHGDLGRLERVVAAERLVSAIPLPRHAPSRPSKPPRPAKPPRVVETLLKAMEWRRDLDKGEAPDQATVAKREGVSRARVTQVLMLLRLAPDIQESILRLPGSLNPPRPPERALRPIALLEDPEEQTAAFEEALIIPKHP
ncbi:MAG: hypothetical protein JXR37_17110 [Kiritimatiellae bacterium]|nr:hypothetical protein [Kiritimatiellia bacterium]